MDEQKSLMSNQQLSLLQPEEQEVFSPYDILNMVARRFYWLLVGTVIVFGAASVVAMRWPDEYKADTLILVDPQKVPERYVSTTVSMDVGGRLSTINQQLMSSTRLQRIIDTYDLYKSLKGHRTQEEIIEQMRSDIKVEVVRNFDGGGRNLGAFRIVYIGRTPALVAQVCNQLASLFIEENLKVREQQAEGTSEFIDTRLDLAKKTLDEQETRLRDYKMSHMGQLPDQSGNTVAQLNGAEQQLRSETETINHLRQSETLYNTQITNMLQAREAQFAALAGSNPTALGPDGVITGGAAPMSEKLASLKSQKLKTEKDIEQYELRYSENHPDVKKAKKLIEYYNKEIEAEEKHLASAPPPALMPPPTAPVANGKPGETARETTDPLTSYKNQLKAIEAEIVQRQKSAEVLGGQAKMLTARLESMPMREQEMGQTDRDVGMLRENYRSLLEKKMSADMAADLEKRQKSERFTILDPARIPEKPFRPNRAGILGGGFASGLGFGVFMIFVCELRDKSVKKEDELTRMGLRILGRIPLVVTTEEALGRRRRRMRNWALGTVATLGVLGVFSAVAYLVTKSVWSLG
jgi:polysaccharide chain length determinant protein (PEP-CTERM system associated)